MCKGSISVLGLTFVFSAGSSYLTFGRLVDLCLFQRKLHCFADRRCFLKALRYCVTRNKSSCNGGILSSVNLWTT